MVVYYPYENHEIVLPIHLTESWEIFYYHPFMTSKPFPLIISLFFERAHIIAPRTTILLSLFPSSTSEIGALASDNGSKISFNSVSGLMVGISLVRTSLISLPSFTASDA